MLLYCIQTSKLEVSITLTIYIQVKVRCNCPKNQKN